MSDFGDLHDELRAVARDLLAKDVESDVRWRQMADAGWLGLEVPEDLEGSGVTFAETAVVLEELGRAATAAPFLGTAVLGVAATSQAEPSEDRDQMLRTIATGTAGVAVVLHSHADSLAAAPPFVLDANGHLTGRAELVLDAAGADDLLLLADSGGGPVLVHATPRSGPGDRPRDVDSRGQNGEAAPVAVRPEVVLDGTRSFASIQADGVAVPGGSVWRLRDDATGAAQAIVDRAALAVAVDAQGVAAAMLDATVAYVSARHQFDRPIGSFQAVKHQCADVLVALRIGGELLQEAVDAVVAADPEGALPVSRAKSYVTAAAVDAVGIAMQLHGGIGYTWESGIHRYLKRALLDRALFGSPAAHRQRIADHRWATTK